MATVTQPTVAKDIAYVLRDLNNVTALEIFEVKVTGLFLLACGIGVVFLLVRAAFANGGQSCVARHSLMEKEADLLKAKARIDGGEDFSKVASVEVDAHPQATAQVLEEEDPQSSERICRYCLQSSSEGRLVSPCLCRGSAKWVHLHCLEAAARSNNTWGDLQACPTCKQPYEGHAAVHLAACGLLILEREHDPDHIVVCNAMSRLAFALHGVDEFERAVALYERVVHITVRTCGPDHIRTATVRSNWGMLLMAVGKYELAKTELEHAMRIEIQSEDPNSEHPMQCESRSKARMELLYSSLHIFESAKNKKPKAVSATLELIAIQHLKAQEYEQADAAIQRQLPIVEQLYGTQSEQVADVLANRFITLLGVKDLLQAKKVKQRELRITGCIHGTNHTKLNSVLEALAQVHLRLGEESQAKVCRECMST